MENEIRRLAAHNDRLAQQRQELEERCAQLVEENTTLKNTNSFEQTERDQMRLRLVSLESDREALEKEKSQLVRDRNAFENLAGDMKQVSNALWQVIEERLTEEIKTMVEDIVDDKLRDYDVTDSANFVDAVHTELIEFDFDNFLDDIRDDQLSAKIAQVISDGKFVFRR